MNNYGGPQRAFIYMSHIYQYLSTLEIKTEFFNKIFSYSFKVITSPLHLHVNIIPYFS